MAQKSQGTDPATPADEERQRQHQQENAENERNRDSLDRQNQPGVDSGHRTSPGGQQSR
jgi:hypothetical protein